MSLLATFGPFVGRVLVALLFLWSGLQKLSAPGYAAARIAAVHIPLATAAAVAAGLVEVLGAVALAVGYKARAAAVVLCLYLLVVTWLFHWPHEVVQVMKNLAIMGGLLALAGHGPGSVSVRR